MKKIISISLLLIVPIFLFSQNKVWKSYSGDRIIEQKVDSVLSLMTVKEKIGQMSQFSANWSVTGPVMPDNFLPYLKKGLIGSIFNAVTVDGVREMQKIAVEKTRLGIPILFGYDVIHGYKTIFPIPLAEACSWDLDLMKQTARIAAEEATADGLSWTFAPMVDISRDPRWGRVMEGAGEDPFLGSQIAKARVEGFQGGKDWRSLKETNTILSCVKHFAAYGAAESGRDYNVAELSEHTLRNVYFPPYKTAIEAGAGTVMAAFNEVNGVPSTANYWLLTKVLREEWGFKGFVVTDYTGINELVPHGVAKDEKQAAMLALKAGNDMDMTGATYIKYLEGLFNEKKITEEQINVAVRRILEMKFLLGLFDDPYKYMDEDRSARTIRKPEFLETARKAVARSLVLLKNDKQLLPIEKNKHTKVALLGPMMKNSINLNGEWQGRGDRNKSVSIYKGLMDVYKNSNVKFDYAKGCEIDGFTSKSIDEAVKVAEKSDVLLVAVGEDFNWSGEAACRTNIQLPEGQQKLLKALKKTGKPIALLILSGRPLDISWEAQNIDAIVQVWFPGSQGGYGVADVVSGDYNPSGKLVMSFPRNVGQIPVYYNQKPTGRPVDLKNPTVDYKSRYIDASITSLFPFGYGLSYTTFSIKNLKLDTSVLRPNGRIVATVDVTNTGEREGEVVVQMYCRDLVGSTTRPIKELKGFQKINLKPQEKRQVQFVITPELLKYYGINHKKVIEPGDFKLWISQNSADTTNVADFSYKE